MLDMHDYDVIKKKALLQWFDTDLLANLGSLSFSKPLERFTLSQRYPGLMLKMFGGGSGPLYTGFSVKEEKSTKKGKKDMYSMAHYLSPQFICSKM